MHWGINPPPPLSYVVPLNRQNVQVPLLGQYPFYIGFSWPPPLKVGFFSEPSKYSKFFILKTILFLKVTKFLGKISQFEFLVMKLKNIFAYKLFLSLKFQILIYLLCDNCNPPCRKGGLHTMGSTKMIVRNYCIRKCKKVLSMRQAFNGPSGYFFHDSKYLH